MRKHALVLVVLGGSLVVGAVGSHPHYLEELRIGGGYGEPVDGGCDLDRAGNATTDGSVNCGELRSRGGLLTLGVDGAARGIMTAYAGAAAAPGCLRLGSTSGEDYYLFASNDGRGLRISSTLPASDTAGQWLRAETVADLSSPPPVGSVTPNTGRFTSACVDGAFAVGTPPSVAARIHMYSGSSGYTGVRNFRTTDALLLENNEDAIVMLQSGTQYRCELWFGDGQAESAGRLRFDHANDTFQIITGTLPQLTLEPEGDLSVTGGFQCEGGQVTAGVNGSARGIVWAASGGTGTTPGVLRLASPGGSSHYVFVEDDGTLKVASSLPSSNSDGVEVGEQYASSIATFSADDTTPAVSGKRLLRVSNQWTAGHNITMFDNGIAGQCITVIGNDADCTVVDGGDLKLNGNWQASAGCTLSLLFDGTSWYETGRSTN